MRFRALLMAALLGAALIAALARPARSAPQSEERVTAIEPPAPPEALAQVPALSAPSDLSSLVGRTVTRVTVVVSGNTLGRPIAAPTLQSLKAGETLTPAAARRAMNSSSRRADSPTRAYRPRPTEPASRSSCRRCRGR